MAEKNQRQQGRLRSRPVRTPVGKAPVGLRVLESDDGLAEGYLYVPPDRRAENASPSAELLACGLSPEAINPCEDNPDPNCAANLPEGAYPSINGPNGVGTNNVCSDLPEGSPEAVACYEDLIGTAPPSASPTASPTASP